MELLALPAFADNYIWMLHDGRQAFVVDPGDSAPVAQTLKARGLSLVGILVTHHHPDHVAGLSDLLPALQATQGRIYGPANEPLDLPYQAVCEGDTISLFGQSWLVLDVPGHTAGHVAYWRARGPDDQAPLLFCGDTLFSAGCGRLRGGTADQLHTSLSRLSSLPGDTLVCCAHEYTLANLAFAQAVEPDNSEIAAHRQHCQSLRDRGLPTVPSSLELERRINPFLRCDRPSVVRSARAHGATHEGSAEVFAALRHGRTSFEANDLFPQRRGASAPCSAPWLCSARAPSCHRHRPPPRQQATPHRPRPRPAPLKQRGLCPRPG